VAFWWDSALGTINPAHLRRFCGCSLSASLWLSPVKEGNWAVPDLPPLMQALATQVAPKER